MSRRLHLCLIDWECWRDYWRYGMPMRLHVGERYWTILSGDWRSKRVWDWEKARVREPRPALPETWDWCGYHLTHPMVSWDPAGEPYCWEGYWRGEVERCQGTEVVVVQIRHEG